MRLRSDFIISARDWAVIVQYHVEQGVDPGIVSSRGRLLSRVLFNVAKQMAKRIKHVPADDVEAAKILLTHGGFKILPSFAVDRDNFAALIKRRKENKKK